MRSAVQNEIQRRGRGGIFFDVETEYQQKL